MYKSIYLLLVCLLILSCTYESTPVEVKERLIFGNYIISPPRGYWYFPRKYPDKFNTAKDLFLITFWEDKVAASRKAAPDNVRVFFNFAVSMDRYEKFDAYYKAAESSGIKYKTLPSEAGMLKSIANWSCKQTIQSFYGIECISLDKNLVTVGVYGSSKSDVLTKIPALKQMIDSVVYKK
jgi:hypothetical protein